MVGGKSGSRIAEAINRASLHCEETKEKELYKGEGIAQEGVEKDLFKGV